MVDMCSDLFYTGLYKLLLLFVLLQDQKYKQIKLLSQVIGDSLLTILGPDSREDNVTPLVTCLVLHILYQSYDAMCTSLILHCDYTDDTCVSMLQQKVVKL